MPITLRFVRRSSSCISAASWWAADARITADLATITAVREGPAARTTQLHLLKRTHGLVVLGLVALSISGVLLFAADVETYLYSRIFWLKIGLIVLLLVNGALLLRRRASGEARRAASVGAPPLHRDRRASSCGF